MATPRPPRVGQGWTVVVAELQQITAEELAEAKARANPADVVQSWDGLAFQVARTTPATLARARANSSELLRVVR